MIARPAAPSRWRSRPAPTLVSVADVAGWVRPAELLQSWQAGDALMLPPTVVSLEEVAAAPSAADFIAELPVIAPVQPELVETTDGLVLRADLPR